MLAEMKQRGGAAPWRMPFPIDLNPDSATRWLAQARSNPDGE